MKVAVVGIATEVSDRFHLLDLEVDGRVAQAAGPGRYAMMTIGEGTDPYLARPYWLRRLSGSRVRLIVETRGRGSRWLGERGPGDLVRFYGPLGREVRIPPHTSRLLLSGTPDGLNCLLSLADEALQDSIDVAAALEPASAELLASLLPPAVELLSGIGKTAISWADAIYVVGDAETAQHVQAILRSSGSRTPAFALSHAPLACGVGACYGCVIATRSGPKLSCVDGPVFRLRDLVWS